MLKKRSIAEEYTSKLSNKREKACGRRNLREDSASRIKSIPKKGFAEPPTAAH